METNLIYIFFVNEKNYQQLPCSQRNFTTLHMHCFTMINEIEFVNILPVVNYLSVLPIISYTDYFFC